MSGIELVMRRRGSTLVPVAQTFEEDLLTVPEGKDVMVRVTMARNPLQDAAYWSAIGDLVKAGVWDGDKDSLSRWLKIALGMVEEIVGNDGKVYYVLQSLSPASMDGIKFTEFFKRVEELVASRFGVDISKWHPADKRKYAAPAAEAPPGLPSGQAEEAVALPGPASSDALLAYAELAAAATTRGELMAVGQKLLQTHPHYREDGRGKARLALYNINLFRILEPDKMPANRFDEEQAQILAEHES